MELDLAELNIPNDFWKHRCALIIGPSCSGKNVLARCLKERMPQFHWLKKITTRPLRESDLASEISSISAELFIREHSERKFFYMNKKEELYYGHYAKDLQEHASRAQHTLLVFRSRGGISIKDALCEHGINNAIPAIVLSPPPEALIHGYIRRNGNRPRTSIELEKVREDMAIDIERNRKAAMRWRNLNEPALEFNGELDWEHMADTAARFVTDHWSTSR